MVQRALDVVGRNFGIQFDVNGLAFGVRSRIRTAGTDRFDFSLKNMPECPLDFPLNRPAIGLALETVETCAVVFKSKAKGAHGIQD